LPMLSLSTLWFVVVFALVIFLLILSCCPSLPFAPFLHEVVLVLFLAHSRTNTQPLQDLRGIGCYRAQSGGMSGEWKSSPLVTNMPYNYFQQQQQHQLCLPCWSVSTVASTLWPGSTSASVSLPTSLPTIRTMASNRLIVDLNRSTSISDALSLFVEKRRPVDHGVVAWVMIYVWYGFYVHHLSPPPRASTSETQNSLHISDFCDRISGSSHFLKQHTKLNWNTTTLAY
jgi:hypothetical protein